MYDKFGAILRIETTIHDAEGLKVYRPKESDPEKKLAWQKMRRSVADLYRRCELSHKANEADLLIVCSFSVARAPATVGAAATAILAAAVKPFAEDSVAAVAMVVAPAAVLVVAAER